VKQHFPQIEISINGGIKSLEQAKQHLHHVDGVMIGREIYSNPYILADVDQQIYQQNSVIINRTEIINIMVEYINQHLAQGGRAWHILRHMLGLCNGLAGARQFRRYLSECASKPEAKGDVLQTAFTFVEKS